MKHTPIFFAERDGPWYPTLRLLHQYPEMMKKLRVDKGALKFVMSGANIMCPGLTSPGATIHDEVMTLLSIEYNLLWATSRLNTHAWLIVHLELQQLSLIAFYKLHP